MQRNIKLPPFLNVGANQTATLELPLGPSYEEIHLRLGGTTFVKDTHLLTIEIKMNGRSILGPISGAELGKMNNYLGLPTQADVLCIPYNELTARDKAGQSSAVLPTGDGVSLLTIEVKIGAATAPTLEAYAVQSGSRSLQNTAFKKLVRFPVGFTSGGKFPINLPKNIGVFKRLWIFHNGQVNLAELKLGGITVHDYDKTQNEFWQKQNKRVPQANLHVVDFCVDGNIDESLVPAGLPVEFYLNLLAGDNVVIYAEIVDVLNNM